ncbi:LacI family DNA-binding transcriptional regulator [Granulicoccus phenolivorans]|uniref:LacI family DNA-binding transcriptional regulator n=1 Tax=Granulicoccus phenolivorans TaxID=266854 RepID=UPI000411DAC3|nr:LacI family DNA-binding transcriptional regulator [Granulicoccus phenolivorans]
MVSHAVPTLEDVAARAGVSRATASRALLRQARVSAATIDKVTAAARELGYVADRGAARLAGHSPRTVGLIIRGARNAVYGELFSELGKHLRASESDVLATAVPAAMQVAEAEAILGRVLGVPLGGLMLANGSIRSEQVLPYVGRLPIMRVGHPESTPELSGVGYDEVTHGRLMADAVAAAGHRRVLAVGRPFASGQTQGVRIEALVARLRERGVAVDTVPVTTLELRLPADTVARALAAGCTALVCASDELAFQAMLAARESGVRVPDDLSVVGFDGYEPGLDLIGLTTVRLPVAAVARRAAELMLELMSTPGMPPVREVIAGELTVRTSLGPPRAT